MSGIPIEITLILEISFFFTEDTPRQHLSDAGCGSGWPVGVSRCRNTSKRIDLIIQADTRHTP
jgi:hypothetical protein